MNLKNIEDKFLDLMSLGKLKMILMNEFFLDSDCIINLQLLLAIKEEKAFQLFYSLKRENKSRQEIISMAARGFLD